MKKQIVNIINFIRDVEPRCEMDLLTPVKEQLKLLNQYNFASTFLLQYDALIDPVYTELLKKEANEKTEFGVWFEVVEPMVKAVGIEWRGRFPWDWHAHCGFSVGYTLEQREQLIDCLMKKFKEVFGYYPKTMGSWTIDAYSLQYAVEKYGLDASCNCKDQYGTDGYTVWGGYYNQAYYPSKDNMLCPAQTTENQINLPVFRMLGSDPIYQYDAGLDLETGHDQCQGVVTLEPVYTGEEGGGGVTAWVDWYFANNFSGNCLAFSYTQAGQENSFGWEAMKDGLIYQFEKIDVMQKQGIVTVETIGDSGRWFKENFKTTPATTVVTENDWVDENLGSVWYNSKNYRINLYSDKNKFWIRDFYLFREKYSERYFEETCKTEYLVFDNLPFVDGNRFTKNGIRAGLYPSNHGKELTFKNMKYKEVSIDTAEVSFTETACGNMKFVLMPDGVKVIADGNKDFTLQLKSDTTSENFPKIIINENELYYEYNNFEYKLKVKCGIVQNSGEDLYEITSKRSVIELSF